MKIRWISAVEGDHVAYDLEMRNLLEQVHEEALQKFLAEANLSDNDRATVMTCDVRVLLNNRMKSRAGVAKGTFQIEMHYRLFSEGKNREELINTYIHELAHIVCARLYPRERGHGLYWQAVMRMMGQKPTRCHSMEVNQFRSKKKQKRHVYVCGCLNRLSKLSDYQHERNIKRGRSVYYCVTCRKDLTYKETLECVES